MRDQVLIWNYCLLKTSAYGRKNIVNTKARNELKLTQGVASQFLSDFDHLIWLPKRGKPFLPNQVKAKTYMFKRDNS